ncbi:hypothetical protein Rhopal_004471-T1 [Rhodotorula paludigena]|uniref:Uncharacterized protein n=1 Tax=Rhodotorula paludigena TaxID=86838 RepID=A0AAV5GRY3_9BASI|nr:hypothetical protein Rhopal_004471-T1 [Rhodotorula paludigena]
MPVDHMSVTFLGTAAGRPSTTRNVSSLVVKLDSKLWVFDAGEATQHQFMNEQCKLPMSKVARIFVTHMHADHINGLPGLLCTISAGEGGVLPGQEDPRLGESQQIPPTEIYGPSGLRLFLRTCLSLTQSILTRPYVVHELLFADELEEQGALHPSERQGRNIRQGMDGFWRDVVDDREGRGVSVSAGPIEHTVRCLGYILTESPRSLPIQPQLYIPHLKRPANAAALAASGVKNPVSLLSRLQTEREPITLADGTVLRPPDLDPSGGRRIIVLGDTYDATYLLRFLRPPGTSDDAGPVDLVVHESTNAFLPTLDESQAAGKVSRETGQAATLASVTATARAHGHSTPQVAGAFAREARATTLVLNHLSVKYPDPEAEGARSASDESRSKWREMLREIERQAGDEMRRGRDDEQGEGEGEGLEVRAARDFLVVEVPRRDKRKKAQGKG